VTVSAIDDHLSALQVSRLMLIVPIGLPWFPRYSRTTITPWSISGRNSGFSQLALFIIGASFASNVVLLTPFDSAFTSVYIEVSFSPHNQQGTCAQRPPLGRLL